MAIGIEDQRGRESDMRLSRRALLQAASMGVAATAGGKVGSVQASQSAPRSFEATYDFTLEHDWLTMADGVWLAVDYYRPAATTPEERFPIVLEALPYRKDDSFALRDYPVYAYLARRGIAGARVDLRGTGSSAGRAPSREYSDAELGDLAEIVAQLAALPWGNGNIGMQGISWSAFNGIMTVMRRQPRLKALLVLHGSQDIYGNDLHYIDGQLHVDIFEMEMITENMVPRPPDYLVDEAYFRDRFDVAPWTFEVLRHQRDGDYWRKGRSLFTDYGAIDVPVYAIGGLLDGYRDYATDMLANVTSPMKGEMGPWNHAWPDNGAPGPNYEWRQTAVRWWQQWLNGVETGVMDEPRFAVFVRGSVPPDVDLRETPGAWWAEDWPLARTVSTSFFPQRDGLLADAPGPAGTHELIYKADTGNGLLNWWGETTGDTTLADAETLLFDSQPLTEIRYVLGVPRVRLSVAANAPLADWVVRLEDVWPDGGVSLVTGGLINGAQRESRPDPRAIVPGEPFTLDVAMHFTTWTYEPGHLIRLVVANGQFPMSWPTPYAMTTTLRVGDGTTELILPFVSATDQPSPPLLPPEPREARPDAHALEGGFAGIEEMALTPFHDEHDPVTGSTTAMALESSAWAVADREYGTWKRVSYSVHPDDPAHASFQGDGFYEVRLPERTVTARASMRVDSDVAHFHVWARKEIAENGAVVREREWAETIVRDFQ